MPACSTMSWTGKGWKGSVGCGWSRTSWSTGRWGLGIAPHTDIGCARSMSIIGLARSVEGGVVAVREGKNVRLSASLGPVVVTTPANTELVYSGHADHRGMFLIWRWERGAWWMARVSVSVGERIGGALTAQRVSRDPFKKMGDGRKVRWVTDYRYMGHFKRGKITRIALLEKLGVEFWGLNGIAWAGCHLELKMSRNPVPQQGGK